MTAIAKNGDANREVGFMTGKPFLEDTGFAEFNRPKNGSDKVGIEMVSNTGQALTFLVLFFFNFFALFCLIAYFFVQQNIRRDEANVT